MKYSPYDLNREAARRRLPHMLFEYIDSGSGEEATLDDNRAAFRRVRLRQSVLRDMSQLDMTADFVGQPSALPVALGPVGFTGMYARRGEVQAARAAEAEGVPFCVSALSVCDYEEVYRDGSKQAWFQLYLIRDRAYMRELLARVRETGARTLVFTVDMPVPGIRYRDRGSGLYDMGLGGFLRQAWQGITRPGWLWDVYLMGRPHGFGNFASVVGNRGSLGDYWAWVRKNFDPSASWDDLAEIRANWPGRIVLKGIMSSGDANRAVALGADAVLVSNHGGRQLDGVRASLDVLPEIVETVAGRAQVLVDGGIRTGEDVLKALALGADGCILGRLWAMALAGGGEQAVRTMLLDLRAELQVAMTLTGCRTLREAGKELLDFADNGRA